MNKWKSSLISLGMTAFFAVGCYFMPSQVNVFWTIVVSTMTFLLSFVFIELLEHTKVLKDFDMDSKYEFFKKCGISEYHKDFSEIDFVPCISAASKIKIVLLYSSRFAKNYISALREFVGREGTTLEIVLLSDNKDSSSYKCISEKFCYGESKISDSLSEFRRIIQNDLLSCKNEKSDIKLYFTELVPAYALYMFDDYAYITLYKTTPQRTSLIPCFCVEKSDDSSFYNFLLNDFIELKQHGKSHLVNL